MKSKQKGNKFERDICKMISLSFSNNADDNIFWRTQSSGGRFTQRKKLGKNTEGQAGDITYTNIIGKPLIDRYYIELKAYSNIDIWSLITKKESKSLYGFLKSTYDLASVENKIPVLIVKQNNKPIIVFTTEYDETKLILQYKYKNQLFYMYLIDDFLNSFVKQI